MQTWKKMRMTKCSIKLESSAVLDTKKMQEWQMILMSYVFSSIYPIIKELWIEFGKVKDR